jgi:predicted small lipoprotein YifL
VSTATPRLILVLSLAALTGCGQKGALYLPDKNATVVAPAPAAPAEQPAPQPSAPGQPLPPKKTDQDGDSQPPQ